MRSLRTRRPTNLGPFATLLATLVGIFFATAFIEESIRDVSGLRLLSLALLLAGAYAVSRRRRIFWIGCGIALAVLGAEAWAHARPSHAAVVANFAVLTLFTVFLGASIFHAILAQDEVTLDTIFGGICVYLLLGIGWSYSYSFIEYLLPGSFWLDGQPLTVSLREDEFRIPEFMYYSFVTLTTLGYGDIAPKSNPARALSVAEAVIGPLFLAVFIARLVSLHMAHEHRRRNV